MNSVHFLNIEYLLTALYDFLFNFDIVAFINWLLWFVNLLKPLALLVTAALLGVAIYSAVRIKQIDRESKSKDEAIISAANVAEQEKELNEKWIKVQELINSTNPSDWRIAILEADIMLSDVLDKAGFKGDTIGNQLKTIEKGDMVSLQSAWEAHKIRNQVAHGGSDYQLSERDAKMAINLYKTVFEEFYHI